MIAIGFEILNYI